MAVPTKPVGGASIESAWGGVVHDTAVAQDIQGGSMSVTITGATAASVPVTFPRPFAAPPTVVASPGTSGNCYAMASAVTASGFQATLRVPASTTLTNTVVWLAYGPRA